MTSTDPETPPLDLDAERRWLIDALTYEKSERPATTEAAAYRLDRYTLHAASRDYLPVPIEPVAPTDPETPQTAAGRQHVAEFDVGQYGRVNRAVVAIEAEARASVPTGDAALDVEAFCGWLDSRGFHQLAVNVRDFAAEYARLSDTGERRCGSCGQPGHYAGDGKHPCTRAWLGGKETGA